MKTTAETTTETDLATHPFYDITTNRIATRGELLRDAKCRNLNLTNYPNLTAQALATLKSHSDQTPLHFFAEGLRQFPGATASFLATIKDDDGRTPLHQARDLHLINGTTAAFLATVTDTNGLTPLHNAAFYNFLHLIPGITADILQQVGLLTPENIVCLTDDLRTNGHHYNKPCEVRTALLKAARLLHPLNVTIAPKIRQTLSAAVEGGLELPPELLAKLM